MLSIITHRQNCICRGAEDDTPITGVSRQRAEAIRYAVEELRTRRSLSAWMQVGEDRFNKEEINRLYDEMIILCARL